MQLLGGGKILKYRFPSDVRNLLESIDFSLMDAEFIKKNISHLNSDLSIEDLDWLQPIIKNNVK